jgi:hypothetical protein
MIRAATCTVAVHPIQSRRAGATKIEVGLGGVLGMIQQFALEMTAAFAAAGSLEVALEVTITAFVLFHSDQTLETEKGSPSPRHVEG